MFLFLAKYKNEKWKQKKRNNLPRFCYVGLSTSQFKTNK